MTKQFIFISILYFLLTTSCSSPNVNKANSTSTDDTLTTKTDSTAKSDSLLMKELISEYDLNRIDTFVVGDVNGDGENDKAVILPLNFIYFNNKIVNQYVNIAFTCNISMLKHSNGFQGLIANVGDLDGNKTDEIVYCPDWYQSNSGGIYIYGYRRNKWTLFCSGSIRRDILEDQINPIKYLKSRIIKIDNYSFKLTQHVWTEDGSFIDSTNTVIIK